MNNTTKETKTERLILNLTVQERHQLKQYHQQSRSASESDFVRKAVELYAVLHRLAVTGSDIVLRNESTRDQVYLPVPKKWTRDSVAIPERATPRRNFELKIEEGTKQVAFQMVEGGAAPSATRLVWLSVGTYAHVLEWEAKGYALMEKRDGKFLPVERLLPSEPPMEVKSTPAQNTSFKSLSPASSPDSWLDETLFGTAKEPREVTTLDVLLHWEGKFPRRATFWLNHLHPLILSGDTNAAGVMKRNLLLGCDYVIVTDDDDVSDLRTAVATHLAPHLKWSEFAHDGIYQHLKDKLEHDFSDWVDKPEVLIGGPIGSPVWMQIGVIVLKDVDPVLLARFHDSPSWFVDAPAEGGLPRYIGGFSVGIGDATGRAMRLPRWTVEPQLETLRKAKGKQSKLWRRLSPDDYEPTITEPVDLVPAINI